MGKKKQKVVLPPELPPEIPDDEVEVSDDDLQFIKENRNYASLLSTLDSFFQSSVLCFHNILWRPYLQCYILCNKLLAKVSKFLSQLNTENYKFAQFASLKPFRSSGVYVSIEKPDLSLLIFCFSC